MEQLKYAVILSSLGGCADRFLTSGYGRAYSVEELFERAGGIKGIKGVELVSNWHINAGSQNEVKSMLKKYNLELVSIIPDHFGQGKWGAGSFSSKDAGVRREAVEVTKELMDMAVNLNCNLISLWPGQDGYDYMFTADYIKERSWLEEGIAECCSYKKEVRVAIEYKIKEPRVRSYPSTVAATLLMVKEIGADNCGVTIDYGHAYSTRLLSEIAAIIGEKEEEEKYKQLYQKIKRVYNKYFIREDGSILDDRQAPNVRTLAFDLADEDKKQLVANKLAVIVKGNDYHLNTGFLSTPFILQALADYGYPDIAYRLLEQETFPSWLYAVKKGATTVWESWRGITPEGETSGSLNHYSYGAVCNFLFAGVAGIKPDIENPGYKHFTIKPVIGGTLTNARARYESIYGTIESCWEKTEDGMVYNLTIPVNTTVTVMLPGNPGDVEKTAKQYNNTSFKDGRIVFDLGSGSYQLKI